MRLFKRTLWLAAWGAWALLGLGLYRELPRDWGSPVAALPGPFGPTLNPIGFIGATDEFAALAMPPRAAGSMVRVFDARTGTIVREMQGPRGTNYFWSVLLDRRGHDIVFAKSPGAGGAPDAKPGLYALDLAGGPWRRLGEPASNVWLCAGRPWVLIIDSDAARHRTTVLDYRTGAEIFTDRGASAAVATCRPFFIADEAAVVVPVIPEVPTNQGVNFEVWRLLPTPSLQRTIPGIPAGRSPSVSSNGRLAFAQGRDPWYVDVFGVAEARILFSFPPLSERPDGGRALKPSPIQTQVASSGRCVLAGSPTALYGVDDGRPVWRAGKGEKALPVMSSEQFFVAEQWKEIWPKWLPPITLETHVFRRLDDGGLVHRTTGKKVVSPSNWNASGTLAVANDGAVLSAPLLVNWPLLALCQAVLALPLLFLWTALWLLKRRRTRRSEALTSPKAGHTST